MKKKRNYRHWYTIPHEYGMIAEFHAIELGGKIVDMAFETDKGKVYQICFKSLKNRREFSEWYRGMFMPEVEPNYG